MAPVTEEPYSPFADLTVRLSDRQITAVFLSLFVFVQGLALALAWAWINISPETGPSVPGSPSGGGPGSGTAISGAFMLAVIVAETALIFGAYWIYSRLPPIWKWAVHKLATLFVWAWAVLASIAAAIIAPVVTLFAMWFVLVYSHLPDWTQTDILGLTGGVLAAMLLGFLFPPSILLVGFVIMILYDHFSVEITGHMKHFAKIGVEWGLPALIIIPFTSDFDYEAYKKGFSEAMDAETGGGEPPEESPKNAAMIIGVGDLALPSALTVSAALNIGGPTIIGPLNVAAALTALGVLAGALAISPLFPNEGTNAGLPALNTGAMAGFAVGFAVTWGLVLV